MGLAEYGKYIAYLIEKLKLGTRYYERSEEPLSCA